MGRNPEILPGKGEWDFNLREKDHMEEMDLLINSWIVGAYARGLQRLRKRLCKQTRRQLVH